VIMWTGFDSFSLEFFGDNGLIKLLSWPTLLLVVGLGLAFLLVPELFQLVIDVVKILFGIPLNQDTDKRLITLGGVTSAVSAADYDKFLESFGLQDIGVKKQTHTLIATDDEGTVLSSGQAEFFERVAKNA